MLCIQRRVPAQQHDNMVAALRYGADGALGRAIAPAAVGEGRTPEFTAAAAGCAHASTHGQSCHLFSDRVATGMKITILHATFGVRTEHMLVAHDRDLD